jgi:hypothetical protein
MPELRTAAVILLLGNLAFALPARGHGAAPAAVEIAIDPSESKHIVVRTTYGMVQTTDAGGGWRWICEGVLGVGAVDRKLVVTDRLVVGTTTGIAVSADRGCAWHGAKLTGAALETMAMAVDPHKTSQVLSLMRDSATSQRRLFVSADGGETWQAQGQDLPAGLQATALLVAPSNGQRLYASGWGSASAAALRSDDRGATWVSLPLPVTASELVLAVDPLDADRVYVRQSVVNTDLLLVSADGGSTWTQQFEVAGGILAAAVSPDGGQILLSTLGAGDVGSGLWSAKTSDLVAGKSGQSAFKLISAHAPRCLTWTQAGVYACGNESADGYTVGLSLDGGATFTALHHSTALFPLSCAPASQTAQLCTATWPPVAIELGIADPWASPPSDTADGTADASATDTSPASPGKSSDAGCQAARIPGPLTALALYVVFGALVARAIARRRLR